ncbi:isochorismate lyase [Brytella acorum]|uniref:chorismate mutase n=1 Tax=Brytella acorum TaxID=2959299 RepID=A0AA35V9C7_9PROT|nr:isochorismate lyase [Brytella acorum]CAI9121917.1 isochorismate lyase [Brytella acorum]
MTDIKTPEQATSLNDVRVGIDDIDRRIIEALALRMRYVERASCFKASAADIPAPERVAAMLPERRKWANAAGIDGNFVIELYERIIPWYIARQIDYWGNHRSGQT